MKSVALVSCVSQKGTRAAPAADLYTSDWFEKAKAWVEAAGFDAWYILSAKHGLVAPDEVIRPYDKKLARMSKAVRKEWAFQVALDTAARVGAHPRTHLTILAGEKYREFLVPELRAMGYRVDVPLKGLGIGEQKRWLAEHIAKAPPSVRRPKRHPNPFGSIAWMDPTASGARTKDAIEKYGTIWFDKAPLRSLLSVYEKLGDAIEREEAAERKLVRAVEAYEGEKASGTLKLEGVKCGKESCHCAEPGGKLHGPYWYVYWSEKGRTKKKYVGKNPANAEAVLKGLRVTVREEDGG